MKNIMYLSQRQINEEQMQDLRRIYGQDTKVIWCPYKVKNGQQIDKIGKDFDVFAVQIPKKILQELLDVTKKQVITPTWRKDTDGEFHHLGWKDVLTGEKL